MNSPFKPLSTKIAFAVVLALGLLLVAVNVDLPFVKYSMVYIKTVSKVLEGTISLGDLISEPNAHAYQKPLGTALTLLPFAALFGYHAGPLVHSFLTTVLFALAVCFAGRRLCHRLGIPEDRLGALLLVSLLSPVAVHQFIAVGPDSLLSAAFLTSFALLDLILARIEARPAGSSRLSLQIWSLSGLYVLSVLATVSIKYYGLAALPVHAVYAAMILRRGNVPLRSVAPLAGAGALLLAGIAVYPGSQIVDTKDFLGYVEMTTGIEGDVPSAGRVARRGRLAILSSNMTMVVVGLALWLNVLVACLARRYRRVEWPVLAVIAIYLAGLMLHHGTFFNLRFLLPIAPFVAALVVRSPRFASRRLVGTSIGLSVALVLALNVQSPLAGWLEQPWERKDTYVGRMSKTFVNLKVGAQMQIRTTLANLEEQVPAGVPLVFVSRFFGDVYHETFELTGAFRPTGEVRYYRRCRDVEPPAQVFYMLQRGGKRCRLPFPAERTEIGKRVERVELKKGKKKREQAR